MSLIGILITLLVMFCFWKNLRSPRTRVLVNLCVAIAVTDVLIVAMEIADVQNQVGYQVVVQTSNRLRNDAILLEKLEKYDAVEDLFHGNRSSRQLRSRLVFLLTKT